MTTRLGAVAFTVLWCEVPICCVPHALSCKAGWAIQLREHPGDHKLWHMQVPEGVPSVSTQCPGLLRVLEPSQRGAPLRLSPCKPSSRKQETWMCLAEVCSGAVPALEPLERSLFHVWEVRNLFWDLFCVFEKPWEEKRSQSSEGRLMFQGGTVECCSCILLIATNQTFRVELTGFVWFFSRYFKKERLFSTGEITCEDFRVRSECWRIDGLSSGFLWMC